MSSLFESSYFCGHRRSSEEDMLSHKQSMEDKQREREKGGFLFGNKKKERV